jgi:cytochrome P450
MEPTDPIAAATHPDPYPYYGALRTNVGEMAFDGRLKLWVASKAAVILRILNEPSFRVRPSAEPVPATIAGSTAGTVYGQLVRMCEGEYHEAARKILVRAFADLDMRSLTERAQWHAHASADRLGPLNGIGLTDWAFDVPIRCIGELVGLSAWPDLTKRVREFVACLSPLSTPAQLSVANSAAEILIAKAEQALAGDTTTSFLNDLRAGGLIHLNAGPQPLSSNLVGLFSQTLDATAGLIGNSLVALIREPQLLRRMRSDESRVGDLVREISRFDAPVQNTRRFVTKTTTVGDSTVRPGDVILVLLGAAGRDGALYERPDRLDVDRIAGPILGFGAGRHQCPGQSAAIAIATGAVRHVLASGLPLTEDRLAWTYRPSLNTRIPQFAQR